MQHEDSSFIARVLIIVSAGPAHFFRPGKNSHGLEHLAGFPKTRRSVPPEQGPGKAWAAESVINAIARCLNLR